MLGDLVNAKRRALLAVLADRHRVRARRESTHFEFIDRPAPRARDIEQMPEALVDQLLAYYGPRDSDRNRYVW